MPVEVGADFVFADGGLSSYLQSRRSRTSPRHQIIIGFRTRVPSKAKDPRRVAGPRPVLESPLPGPRFQLSAERRDFNGPWGRKAPFPKEGQDPQSRRRSAPRRNIIRFLQGPGRSRLEVHFAKVHLKFSVNTADGDAEEAGFLDAPQILQVTSSHLFGGAELKTLSGI